MKLLKKSIYLILPILLLIPNKGFCQNTESKDLLNNKLKNAAREIMTSARTCALITVLY